MNFKAFLFFSCRNDLNQKEFKNVCKKVVLNSISALSLLQETSITTHNTLG